MKYALLVAALLPLGGLCAAAAMREGGFTPPPKDAIVLFDGHDTSQWLQRGSGKPAEWPVADGAMTTAGTDIYTKQTFGDYQLHVEFFLPVLPPEVKGQARANSGVYLGGLYEIQVLDSYGLKSENNDCGAIYEQAPPMVNACKPPGEWQAYDILFHAARFDDQGNMAARPRISALQNGLWIQDNVEVNHPTRASMEGELDPKKPLPVMLQFHGNQVRYRNIWLRPLGGA
jgi:hypothetical protein